jgi:hypothetical protein
MRAWCFTIVKGRCLAAFVLLSAITLFPRAAASESPSFRVEILRAWIDQEPHIEGKTNLPNGDELEIVISTEQEGALALGHANVKGRQFRSGKFNTDIGGGQPLRPGRYIVEITAVDEDASEPVYVKMISINNSRKTASSIKVADSKTSGEIISQQVSDAAVIEKRVRELITPVFGTRLKEVDASGAGNAGVRVFFLAGAKEELAVGETRIEMRKAYQAIFTSDVKGINEVTLLAYAPVIDQLGNATMQIVYATQMSKQVAEIINWKNGDSLDFTKLWRTQAEDPNWSSGKQNPIGLAPRAP